VRRLPDLLTWSRVVAGLTLPWLSAPVLAGAVYLWCGLSDVLDGRLARRWGVDTERGAVLDTLADVAFWVGIVGWLLRHTSVVDAPLLVVVAAVTVIRAGTAVRLRRRTGGWRSVHTRLDRITGVLLFVLVPCAAIWDRAPLWLLLPVGALAVAAAVEESAQAGRASAPAP